MQNEKGRKRQQSVSFLKIKMVVKSNNNNKNSSREVMLPIIKNAKNSIYKRRKHERKETQWREAKERRC